MKQRMAVTVRGIVQGVGFRPFLHRLAAQHALCGWACNTADGVSLELEGEETALAAFLSDLQTNPPLLAELYAVEAASLPELRGETAFTLRESVAGAHNTLVSPDVGTCPACLRELRDPNNRRYRYPFINCTDCGPRFTITKTVPYDRKNTTMAPFVMCPACAAEYGAIASRRYHAQPDCCPVCGPKLWFCGADGVPLAGDALAHAKALLRRGGILAVKGLGGFHLACTVADPAPAVALRRRKHRDGKPFALMCPDVAAAAKFCAVTPAEAELLASRRKPIVLLHKKGAGEYPHLSRNARLGVMLPYTPLHTLLFDPLTGADGTAFDFDALVMTSANLSDCPAITSNEDALRDLAEIADGFLLHDRAIDCRCDDSLLRADADGGTTFFRRSRGYAPQPLAVLQNVDGILALGAEQKASFTLGKGTLAFAGAHIGDLKNAETYAHYTEQIARFEGLFGVKPKALACDYHPDYLSTGYAVRRAASEGLPLTQIQHHHAHMAACMADNQLSGEVIGLVWDGTGLGTDGEIWGGEWLTGGYAGFTRQAALRPVKLLGGDAAVKEIGRIGFALATDAAAKNDVLPYDATRRALFGAMLAKNLQTPKSSGMGRLFDGVYALLTGETTAGYEGEAATLLEALADPYFAPDATQPVSLPTAWYNDAAGLPRLDTRPLIVALCQALQNGESSPELAARFHQTLVGVAVAGCEAAREATGLNRVVLSGGVFLNEILLRRVTAALRAANFEVYRHNRVSPGDEGLSLGQLVIAAAKMQNQ